MRSALLAGMEYLVFILRCVNLYGCLFLYGTWVGVKDKQTMRNRQKIILFLFLFINLSLGLKDRITRKAIF